MNHHLETNTSIALAWTQVQRPVYSYICSLSGDFQEAEDILQNVAVAFVERFATRESDEILPWALSVARHKVIDHIRRNSRDRQLFDARTLETIEAAYVTAAPEQSDITAALADCLKTINPRHRRALEDRYRHGLSLAEIASSSQSAESAIGMLLFRARSALRRCIERRLGWLFTTEGAS